VNQETALQTYSRNVAGWVYPVLVFTLCKDRIQKLCMQAGVQQDLILERLHSNQPAS
jgi:hypothetical protein